ncbi:methionine--tRNA ligase [Patescibacteria group bacterium]|nr:methionine--tRNA ligase [Patescibacteria group bacterium]MCL5091744.1 methionine--tRNA ligase [Patescibacteria group bacterium]
MKKPLLEFADFQKLDLRVGLIKNAEPVTGAKKLIKLTVELGQDYGCVTILSGISAWYRPRQLVGKHGLFLANLRPKKMFSLESAGMILVFDTATRPIIIPVRKAIAPGTTIS